MKPWTVRLIAFFVRRWPFRIIVRRIFMRKLERMLEQWKPRGLMS